MRCETLLLGHARKVKPFAKCLAHDGTLERCVPLVPKVHTLLSHLLKLA
jgi:hypothetical protein